MAFDQKCCGGICRQVVRFHTENKVVWRLMLIRVLPTSLLPGLGIFVIVDPDGAKYVLLSHILISCFPPLPVNNYQTWRPTVPYDCQVRVKPCEKDEFKRFSVQDTMKEKSIRIRATASISKCILKTTLIMCHSLTLATRP